MLEKELITGISLWGFRRLRGFGDSGIQGWDKLGLQLQVNPTADLPLFRKCCRLMRVQCLTCDGVNMRLTKALLLDLHRRGAHMSRCMYLCRRPTGRCIIREYRGVGCSKTARARL